jgi:hypothetical protein
MGPLLTIIHYCQVCPIGASTCMPRLAGFRTNNEQAKTAITHNMDSERVN